MWLALTLACSDGDKETADLGSTDDACPDDPDKDEPGQCGCEVPDEDPDGDDVASCVDDCPTDPEKQAPGGCGCGTADVDVDEDGLLDCEDPCPGGGEDGDGDGIDDACDLCPTVPDPGQEDDDADGVGDACWCDPQPAVCTGSMAGTFPCSNVDLVTFLPVGTFGASSTNDVWGWTDTDGREYTLLGLDSGTAFLDTTNPYCPIQSGFLPAQTGDSLWRDVETLGDYVIIGSEAMGHGLQVFDLTRLRGADDETFTADAVFRGLGSSHTVTVDPVSGTVVANGDALCRGLSFVDFTDPLAPVAAGCFDGAGYVHDSQCVTYTGPDPDWSGRVICIASAGESGLIVVVDATDPYAPTEVSRFAYGRAATAQGGSGFGYSHQGWFTEDQAYWLFDDELDELQWGVNTTTWIFDLRDLDAPALVSQYVHDTVAIDHNQFVVGNYVYQSNYTSGLRIFELTDVATGDLTEAGFFDVYPRNDARAFEGTWSNYPFFASGVIPVTSIGEGIVLVKPNFR